MSNIDIVSESIKATTMLEVRDLFDPQRPLDGEGLKYYVDRGGKLKDKVKWLIKDQVQPQKMILPAMRGNGNTTELNKLEEDIKNDFFVIHINAVENLDPIDIEYTDLLLLIGFEIYDAVKRNKIKIPDKLQKSLEDWSNEVVEIIEKEGTEVGSGINYFFNLLSKMQMERSVRKHVREATTLKLGELIDIINLIIAYSEKKINKKIFVIVDSLDRIIDLNRAINLFYWHSSALTLLNCNIIYLASRIIQQRWEYDLIKRNYASTLSIPHTKIFDKNGRKIENGFNFLNEVALNRMNEDLVTSAALEYAIEKSGGVIHDFVRIMRESAFEAHRNGNNQIEVEDVKGVITEFKRDLQKNLKKAHMEILEEVNRSGERVDSPEFFQLLHSFKILDFENDNPWYAVHPILK